MIIIDGMDNTGKTTLAKRLAEEVGYEYIHSPGPNPANEMFDWCLQEMKADRKAIYDRFPALTDCIYGEVLRGGSPFTRTTEGKLIRTFLSLKRNLIIYCRPSDESILNFGDRDQMEGVVKNADKLLYAYDKHYEIFSDVFEVKHFNYEEDDFDTLLALVKHHIYIGGQANEKE